MHRLASAVLLYYRSWASTQPRALRPEQTTNFTPRASPHPPLQDAKHTYFHDVYAQDGSVESGGSCYGHGPDDVMSWRNLFDTDNHYYTNREVSRYRDTHHVPTVGSMTRHTPALIASAHTYTHHTATPELTPINLQLYNYLAPGSEELPYVYDSFSWPHCVSEGYSADLTSKVETAKPQQSTDDEGDDDEAMQVCCFPHCVPREDPHPSELKFYSNFVETLGRNQSASLLGKATQLIFTTPNSPTQERQKKMKEKEGAGSNDGLEKKRGPEGKTGAMEVAPSRSGGDSR